MVEWRKIGEVCDIERGIRVVKKDLDSSGEIPVFQNSLTPLGYYGKSNNAGKIPFVIVGGAAGEVGYSELPFWAADDCLCIKNKDNLIGKFVFFYLQGKQNYLKSQVRKAGVPRLSRTVIEKMAVPVPSIAEQHRIVGILDTFTTAIDNLKQQIEQRRKQYEYYRDQLLDLEGKERVEMKTLGEVCDFVRGPFGGALKKEIFVKEGFAVYEQQHAIYGQWVFRYYIDETKFSEMKRFEVKPGDILMSCSGTMGKTSIVPTDCVKGIINQALLKLTAKDDVSNRYLKLYMDSQWFQDGLKKQTAGGAIQNVASVSVLKDLAIPVPSLTEQSRIVGILDTFEASIANLEQQLEMRQKQYEYYRNQLLTFE